MHPLTGNITNSLKEVADKIFGPPPVLFAYLYGSFARGITHPFSDLDIAVYTKEISRKERLNLELAISVEIDRLFEGEVTSEVRAMNELPLMLLGNIITEGILIYSINEEARVDFETSVRSAYFDFLPVIKKYYQTYSEGNTV